MFNTQPTVELSTRFGINKMMPKEQDLDFIQPPVNLKE